MAALATTTASRTGFNLTTTLTAAAGGGDTFTNTGACILVLENAGSQATVTIVTSETRDGLAVADRTVTLAANALTVIGPFPRYLYGSTVSLTYSGGASINIAVVKVTPEVV